MKDYTPAKPCSSPTPINSKKDYISFDDIYFLKLNIDENFKNIILVCYNTTELENKRYEVKISKFDFEQMEKIFKMYNTLEDIYKLVIPIIESKRYKIISQNDEDKLIINLNFIINDYGKAIEINLSVEMKLNTNGDFTSDFNYILRHEIIQLKKKYNQEIFDLKKQNKSIINELNEIKKMIKNSSEGKIYTNNPNSQNYVYNPREQNALNLKGKKLDAKALQSLINYPNIEKLNISDNNITDISILNKCRFKELKHFDLSNNKISDITVLKEFKFQKLNELYLNQNKISNIEPLSKIDLTHLLRINLSYNNIDDINTFYRVNAPQLKYLNLSHNKIEDITVFGTAEFKDMKELYLDNNQIDESSNSYIINFLKSKITKFTYK